jgi:hypothetical protein
MNTAGDENNVESDVSKPPKSSLHPQPSSVEDQKPPPATPIGRVPLAELIGNNEDAFENRPALTPVERVLWNHSPTSSDFANSLMTPAVRRATKRGRSSSPPSSSREEALRKGPPFDLQTLQRSLTTPLADPAGDLWSRYSINRREKPTPSKPDVQPPHDLLQSSSPQTPARYLRENDSSGLRRTMSCGTAWPTSAAKRRKIQKSHSQVVDRNIHGPAEHHNNVGVSKVSFLLNKIHEGLAHKSDVAHDIEPSSSSSPTLDELSTTAPAVSPSNRLPVARHISPAAAPVNSLQYLPRGDHVIQEIQVQQGKMQMPEKDSSSDYGDDAIDEDFFDEVTASMQVEVPSRDIAMVPAPGIATKRIIEPAAENTGLHAATVKGSDLRIKPNRDAGDGDKFPSKEPDTEAGNNGSQGQGNDEYEFEEDDELFAADLENIAAMYDQEIAPVNPRASLSKAEVGLPPKPSPRSAKNVFPQSASTAGASSRVKEYVEVSSDDEFGAGLELEQLAFELNHATQAAEAASSSHVRTTYNRPPR